MATYRHFTTLAQVIDEERWLDNIILHPQTLIQNGVSEMIFKYEDVQVAFLSDNPFLRINGDLDGFDQGIINTIELRSADGSEVYERISGLALDAKDFSDMLPEGGAAVAAGGLAHEIWTDGIQVADHYGNATIWDGSTYQAASRYSVVLDQNNPINIQGGFRLDEMVDYQFLVDGSSNPNGVFVDLNNLANDNNLRTLEPFRAGVASFYSESGGPAATIHSLSGINDASGSDGADKLIGRIWYEGPSGFDPDGNLIEGVDGSELHGNDGNDVLLNGMITYGGDGDDIIAPAAQGTFSDQTVITGVSGSIDSLVIDGAQAYGGEGNDTFVVPDFGLGGGTLMFFDGGAGSDTLTFSADGVDMIYAFDRAFQPGSFIDLGQGGPGLVNLEEATTGPLGNTKVITVQGIENVIGTLEADDIRGSFAANDLRGGDGNDAIIGRLGDDIIEGGAGIDNLDGQEDMDMVSYESSDAAVIVDLRTQIATGGHAGTEGTAGIDRDTLANFESARGTGFNDHLIGTDDANVLEGLDGNDRLEGLGGNDIIRSGNATFGSQPFDVLVLPTNPVNESPETAIDLTNRMTLTLNGGNPNFTQNGEPVTSVIGQGDGTGAHFYKITVDENTTKLTFNTAPPQGTNIFGAVLQMEITRPNGAVDQALGSFTLFKTYTALGSPIQPGEYLIRIYNNGDPEIPVAGEYEFIIRAEGFPVDELRGMDVLDGGDGADQLYAGDGEDELIGGEGTDYLDGGANNDLMVGGTENDVYVVRDTGDVVFEAANEGDDIVDTYATWTMSDNVEVLRMQGSDNIDATGTDQRDLMYGNSGENVLDGGAGADVMAGGDGDDVYTVDNSFDAVIEAAGEGFDNVYTSIDYIISEDSEIESALLQGTAVVLRGSNSDNQLIGNDEVNVIDGRGGTDYMLGLGGNDIFQLGVENGAVDVIGDFQNGDAGKGDRIAFTGFNADNTTVTQVSAVSFEVRDTMGTVQTSDDTVQQFQLFDGFGIGEYTGGALVEGEDYYFG